MKNKAIRNTRNWGITLLIFLVIIWGSQLTAQVKPDPVKVEVKDAPEREYIYVRLDESGAWLTYVIKEAAMITLTRKDASTFHVRLEPSCSPMHIKRGKGQTFITYKVTRLNNILKMGSWK